VDISFGLAIGRGLKCMAAGTEDGLDLIMNGKKLLGLFRRFEPPHNLFSPSGGAM
jgi:hypothetical protein